MSEQFARIASRLDDVSETATRAAADVEQIPNMRERMDSLSSQLERATGAMKLAAWGIPVGVAAAAAVVTVLARVLAPH